jgi:hypothetical protein
MVVVAVEAVVVLFYPMLLLPHPPPPPPPPPVIEPLINLSKPDPVIVEKTVNINIVNVARNFNDAPRRDTFDGRFALNFPQISFEVNEQEFIFNGCNTYRVPFLLEAAEFRFGRIGSTRNDCAFDPAELYVKQLLRLRRLGRRDNDIFFFDSLSDEPLFGARLRNRGLRRQFAFSDVEQGIYDAQFPSFNVEFRNNNFFLQGCENDPVQFLTTSQGTVSFRRSFSGRDCFVDRRDIFNDFFRNSERVKFRGDSNDFMDRHGSSIASCSPFSWK